MTDVWSTVHAERAALADDLAQLTPAQWATPSLCSEWTVHDVLAHLVATAKTTRWRFLRKFAAARFDFHAFTADGVLEERAEDPAETLAAFRAVIDRTSTPPAPIESRLVEAFVHGEDIRRPLGLRREYPVAEVVRAITLQARTDAAFGGGKARVAGVEIRATDADFTLGTGPVLEGPAISLLLAVCGRRDAFAELSGPGLPLVAARG
jgi:uncharacterized protein (TIGR03083 family)